MKESLGVMIRLSVVPLMLVFTVGYLHHNPLGRGLTRTLCERANAVCFMHWDALFFYKVNNSLDDGKISSIQGCNLVYKE